MKANGRNVVVRKLRIDEHMGGEKRYTFENGSFDHVLSIWTKHIGRGEMSGTVMRARFKTVEILNSEKKSEDYGICAISKTDELFYGCPDIDNDKELNRVIADFEAAVGFSLNDFQKYYDKINSKCPTCGGTSFAYRGGYLGETLKICLTCNDICGAEFEESDII